MTARLYKAWEQLPDTLLPARTFDGKAWGSTMRTRRNRVELGVFRHEGTFAEAQARAEAMWPKAKRVEVMPGDRVK
jgi:hypothetical protein